MSLDSDMFTALDVPNTCPAPPITIPQLMLPGIPPPLYLTPPNICTTTGCDYYIDKAKALIVYHYDWKKLDTTVLNKMIDGPPISLLQHGVKIESQMQYVHGINSALRLKYDSYRGNFPVLSTGGSYITFRGQQVPLNK